jgi:hypothetical protein
LRFSTNSEEENKQNSSWISKSSIMCRLWLDPHKSFMVYLLVGHWLSRKSSISVQAYVQDRHMARISFMHQKLLGCSPTGATRVRSNEGKSLYSRLLVEPPVRNSASPTSATTTRWQLNLRQRIYISFIFICIYTYIYTHTHTI